MAGVTWTNRRPSDWLASNGRWYPESQYPTGWGTSALPPAPGHAGSGAVLQKVRSDGAEIFDRFEGSPGSTSPRTKTQAGGSTSTTSPARTPPQRGSASANVVSTRNMSPKLTSGPKPPPQLPPPGEDPPAPPGRVRTRPAQTPAVAPPPPPPTPKTEGSGGLDVVAGDLGRVFGTAKKRIQEAIEESAAEHNK